VIARYTHPDMGRLWSDERRYQTWLLVETAAADAMADAATPTVAATDTRAAAATATGEDTAAAAMAAVMEVTECPTSARA